MNEEQPSYKVTDRRLFNPDGSPREVPAEEKPEPTPQPATTAAEVPAAEALAAETTATTPEPDGAVGQTASSDAVEPQPQPAAGAPLSSEELPDEAEAELPGADDPASFASFMMSIASNAASSLGMMEHPVTHKREVDIELGKHWIDVLGMLEQKTRGNLLPQEQQILESLLADLRMQYVSLTHATPPKPRTYSSRDIVGG
ncbi:MAG TPA: DUF1844 domain-containing protein [Pyrinomonadaceae bacterium]|nr:DUF1844 domain-containing protein [Pyrinomonadaceae bacterium]